MADYDFPADLRYSNEDEWVRDEGAVAVIGITDYAQQQLGDIVFVELPDVGATLTEGEPFGVIESVKAVSDLYAPCSGTVKQVNEALTDQPELVNSECYVEGWIIEVEGHDPEALETLLEAEAYAKHVQSREE